MSKHIFFLGILLICAPSVFAQSDWQGLSVGASSQQWKQLKDISNPNSLEESAFV